MTVRVTIDRDAVTNFFKTDPGALAILKQIAEDILATAQDGAPDKTGYYKRMLRLRKVSFYYRVYSADPFGHLVEWGSVNNKPYGTLRAAALASGWRLIDNPKDEGDNTDE